jgi:protein SCO1
VKAGLRVFLMIGVVAILIGGGVLALTLVEQSATPPAAQNTATDAAMGGPFTLVDADGHTVTDQNFRGKWMLVYFGYTFCPDICPTTLNNIAQALVQLGPDAKAVVPLFITIDPKRDTPKIVGNYVKAFDPRIIGLTGTKTQTAAVAQEYHVYYAIQPGSGSAKGNDYLIDHSSFIYLMNRQGKFAKVFPGSLSGGEMADTIRPFIDSTS